MDSLKKYHGGSRLRAMMAVLAGAVAALAFLAPPTDCKLPVSVEEMVRLERGEVLLQGSIDGAQSGLVEGKILINSTPEAVWNVVKNPNEFANKIQKHLREVHVVKDTPKTSILDCQVEVVSFFPRINYVVESFYEPHHRIEFRRIGGSLRDFRGHWILEPADKGRKTVLSYAMYIDPGFFVPQWIMRAGLRRELPLTLVGIKNRVHEIEIAHIAHQG